jgi:predicted DNA-binding transcriptional regulator YafY
MHISHNDVVVKGSLMGHIRQAALSSSLVRITYTDAKGVTTVRTVEPYEIKDNKFFGFCTHKQGIRAFDLLRISHAEQTGESFNPRFEIKIV